LEEVSTTRGSGWLSHADPKSIGISHADHSPTRYRGVVLTSSNTNSDFEANPIVLRVSVQTAQRQRRGIWQPGASAERSEARRPWV